MERPSRPCISALQRLKSGSFSPDRDAKAVGSTHNRALAPRATARGKPHLHGDRKGPPHPTPPPSPLLYTSLTHMATARAHPTPPPSPLLYTSLTHMATARDRHYACSTTVVDGASHTPRLATARDRHYACSTTVVGRVHGVISFGWIIADVLAALFQLQLALEDMLEIVELPEETGTFLVGVLDVFQPRDCGEGFVCPDYPSQRWCVVYLII